MTSPLKIIKQVGNDDIAKVYIGTVNGMPIEFAESTPTPFNRNEKWVVILSCISGCPVRCKMCDAGRSFQGCLSKEDMFAQIDYLVQKRFPDGEITSKKFKIQFTRIDRKSVV